MSIEKKTLVIDNYDSFVFNLVQYVGELGGNPVVYKNDEITLSEVKALNPSHIIISPGPGDPSDPLYFGVCTNVIREIGKTIPLLGVCLGHQGIGHVFGAQVIRAPEIIHGKVSKIIHQGKSVFTGLSTPLEGMRYHSLCVSPENFPNKLEVTAQTQDGVIMGLMHKEFPIHGIQFHPESIGSPDGKQMIQNFLSF